MSEGEISVAGATSALDTGDGQRSAGQLLRELREAAGVDFLLLASAMKVSSHKLQALESDQFEQLPDITFARGLASAICRAFGADPAPVLARMPASSPGLRPPAQDINQTFRRTGDRPAPFLASAFPRPLLIAIGGLLLGAAALWFLPTLPIQLGAPASGEAPAGDGLVRESVTSVPVAEPTPAEMPAGAASAEQEHPPTAATAAASAAAPAVAGTELLQFTASAETWVTVRDAAGKQLVNRTLAAGETLGLNGEAPLSVTIGRKEAVDVRVRGEPFNHRALSKTTVSRFQVK